MDFIQGLVLEKVPEILTRGLVISKAKIEDSKPVPECGLTNQVSLLQGHEDHKHGYHVCDKEQKEQEDIEPC